jgi:hypothetical protein
VTSGKRGETKNNQKEKKSFSGEERRRESWLVSDLGSIAMYFILANIIFFSPHFPLHTRL